MTENPQHANVSLPDVGPVAARVALGDGHATAVLLSHPAHPLDGALGATVSVDIVTVRGVLHADARIAGVPSGEVLELDLTGTPELIQRRDFVRVDAFVNVEVQPPDGDSPAIETQTLNVGGGGALIAHMGGYDIADRLHLLLHLTPGDPPLALDARVVRDAGSGVRAVRFEDISTRLRDRLVHFVFQRQRVAMQMVRERR